MACTLSATAAFSSLSPPGVAGFAALLAASLAAALSFSFPFLLVFALRARLPPCPSRGPVGLAAVFAFVLLKGCRNLLYFRTALTGTKLFEETFIVEVLL